jgi:hypothetical protein
VSGSESWMSLPGRAGGSVAATEAKRARQQAVRRSRESRRRGWLLAGVSTGRIADLTVRPAREDGTHGEG